MTTDACSYATITISATRMPSFPNDEMVRSLVVADRLILAKRKGEPKEIAYFQGLYNRQARGEVVTRSEIEYSGYMKSGETPYIRVFEISSTPHEIINEIKLLRRKDFSEKEIAGQVKLKYLGKYSPDQISLAYRLLDEERRQAVEDERDNTAEYLNKAKNNVAEVAGETREEVEAEHLRAEYVRDFAIISDNGKVLRLNYQGIADRLREKYNTVTFNEVIYIFNQLRGIYQENKGTLESQIETITRTIEYKGSVTSGIKEVLCYVKYSDIPVQEYPFNHCEDFIPVQNGIVKIDLVTGKHYLLDHSAEHLITFTLPVTYDPEADSTFIGEVLAQWVAEEDISILSQIPAQALI